MIDYFKIAKFFLCLSVLSVAIVSTATLFPFIVGKYAWFRTSVDLALIFFLLGLLFSSQNSSNSQYWENRLSQIFKSPLVIAVTVFMIVFVLAGFFGVDPAFSFWSNFERGEGGFQIIHLWLFFILLSVLFKEENDWQRFLKWILVGAALMVFYGIAAHLKSIDPKTFGRFIGESFNSPGFRFMGSIGNPAYVATYLIFALVYILYLLAVKYGRRLKSAGALFLIAAAIFFFIFFLLAATRGAFLGLGAGIVAVLTYLGFSLKKWRKKFMMSAAIFVLVIVLLVNFRQTTFIKKLPFSRIFDVSFTTETFQHRLIMWKIALKGFQERPLLGWGPENYLHIFEKHFDPAYYVPGQPLGAWFDRAHSVYFDYLAEIGALGLLSYLAIFAVFYWQFFKKARTYPGFKRSEMNNNSHSGQSKSAANQLKSVPSPFESALFFALPITYLVQGLVLFEVLPIYMNLFLFLAFSNYKFTEK